MSVWRRVPLAAALACGSGLGVALAQINGPIPPAMLAGSWKAPNGTCQAAFFKAGAEGKSKRGEDALVATVSDKGTTVEGQIILRGARQGQLVNPMTDRAIFLIDILAGSKVKFIPIGEPVLTWPEIDTEKCP
jgi:hypothetical protein